jgi:hypothetical protein
MYDWLLNNAHFVLLVLSCGHHLTVTMRVAEDRVSHLDRGQAVALINGTSWHVGTRPARTERADSGGADQTSELESSWTQGLAGCSQEATASQRPCYRAR